MALLPAWAARPRPPLYRGRGRAKQSHCTRYRCSADCSRGQEHRHSQKGDDRADDSQQKSISDGTRRITHYAAETSGRLREDSMSTKGTHIPEWLTVPFAGITPAPSQQKGQDLFPTGNWRAIRPVYRDKMPPCNNACGTNEKIQGYLDLVKRGKYLDAYALIKEEMPFPSVTGRVCYHPCEQACNRGTYDEAISIRAVERFLGDLGQALPRDVVTAGPPNGKKVAVVGSGPAGHSAAYQLARLGYAVTILEKSPKAGGLNRGGIPDWVLPQEVLDREIERLVELGITIKTNTEVGKDVTWDGPTKQYDAVVLAVGLIDPNSARAEGEDKDGVVFGLPRLRDIGMSTSDTGTKRKPGPRVHLLSVVNAAS